MIIIIRSYHAIFKCMFDIWHWKTVESHDLTHHLRSSMPLGLIPLPWVLRGELFPRKHCGLGSGLTSGFGFMCFFVVIKTTPLMMEFVKPEGTFAVYGSAALIEIVLCPVSCWNQELNLARDSDVLWQKSLTLKASMDVSFHEGVSSLKNIMNWIRKCHLMYDDHLMNTDDIIYIFISMWINWR